MGWQLVFNAMANEKGQTQDYPGMCCYHSRLIFIHHLIFGCSILFGVYHLVGYRLARALLKAIHSHCEQHDRWLS